MGGYYGLRKYVYEEDVRDFDVDIEQRKALIEEAKQIEDTGDWSALNRELSDLQRRWRRIYYWESAYEDTLEEEFDALIDKFYAKRRELYASVEETKKDLIKQAKALMNSTDWNRATEAMKDLMTQWKAAGSAGKEKDDVLWEEFNVARNTFFDRKHTHWEDMQTKFEQARKVKEELIEEAKKLEDSTAWQASGNAFKELFARWKEAGSAGREYEDDLWNAFHASRQKFYAARDAYYDELHEKQDALYQQKEELLAKAKEIAENTLFTREDTAAMKQLSVDWKAVGFTGKERDDEIWKAFRDVMDTYFAGLKQFNESKHAQWRQRMEDRRMRKTELIQEQKRQIQRIERDMVALLGERAIEDAKERIADKEDFIKTLEAEIEELDKALAQ